MYSKSILFGVLFSAIVAAPAFGGLKLEQDKTYSCVVTCGRYDATGKKFTAGSVSAGFGKSLKAAFGAAAKECLAEKNRAYHHVDKTNVFVLATPKNACSEDKPEAKGTPYVAPGSSGSTSNPQ
jgi:hypothetical protein